MPIWITAFGCKTKRRVKAICWNHSTNEANKHTSAQKQIQIYHPGSTPSRWIHHQWGTPSRRSRHTSAQKQIQIHHPGGTPSRRSRHTSAQKQIQIHHLAAQAERRGKSVTRSGTSWHHAQIQNTSYASTTKLEPIANIKGEEDRAHTAQEHASFARMRNHIAIQNLAGNLQRPKAYHAPL